MTTLRARGAAVPDATGQLVLGDACLLPRSQTATCSRSARPAPGPSALHRRATMHGWRVRGAPPAAQPPDAATQPLILPADAPARGRAGGCTAPPRGPGQADRHGPVHRRPGLPRRLVRPHDPLDRAACPPAGHRPRPAFDWSKVVVLTAKDIPGDNVVSLIADDQPVLVRSAARSATRPSRSRCSPRRIAKRCARPSAASRCAPSRCAPVFDPLLSDAGVRPVQRRQAATSTPASWRGRTGHRGRRTGSATRSSSTSRTRR